ncbi:MAG: acyl-CoA thioesterase [Kaiparowitsia implicata GSE-PSE-MK54-09C]|nr:acyl-CoA thioesterase [Kaiparowitsia implicata GSE-PSE-MK54-09C]
MLLSYSYNELTLPTPLPIHAIQRVVQTTDDGWFEYPVHVYPHHTDYAGRVWHGTYISWMEEARVTYMQLLGLSFAELVAMGCDLPVVDLSLRYHQPLRMGDIALVKTRINQMEGVRMVCDYRIEQAATQKLCATAQVTLVPIDQEKGKIMRQLPPTVKQALTRLMP